MNDVKGLWHRRVHTQPSIAPFRLLLNQLAVQGGAGVEEGIFGVSIRMSYCLNLSAFARRVKWILSELGLVSRRRV